MHNINWTRKAKKRGGSIMISIPPELSKAFGIIDGDTLIVESGNNHIIIYKEKKEGYDHLLKYLPRMGEFWQAHEKPNEFLKAYELCEIILSIDRKFRIINPNYWYKLYELINWIGSPTTEQFEEFKKELTTYLEDLNNEIGTSFHLGRKPGTAIKG